MFYRERAPGPPDRFLPWKLRAFVAGAVVGLVGMRLESAWLVGGAVLLLGTGLLLRFIPRDGTS